MEWHYEKDGAQHGPISEMDLHSLYQSQQVTGTTLVWREGLENWSPLAQAAPHMMSGATTSQSPPPAAAEIQQSQSNPYSTPNNPYVAPATVGIGATGETSVGNALSKGFGTLFSSQFGWLLLAAFVWGIIFNIATSLPCINIVVALVFTIPFQAGLYYYCLGRLRGTDPMFSDIFAGFRRNFAQLILMNLVTMGFGMVVALAAGIAFLITNADLFSGSFTFEEYIQQFIDDWTTAIPRLGIPVVVAVLLGGYMHLVLFFATPLIVDKMMGLGGALKTSVRTAHQHFFKLLTIGIVCGILVTAIMAGPSIPIYKSALLSITDPEVYMSDGGGTYTLLWQILTAILQGPVSLILLMPMLALYTDLFDHEPEKPIG